jgi:tagatose-1,6-bisphosphate aldolase
MRLKNIKNSKGIFSLLDLSRVAFLDYLDSDKLGSVASEMMRLLSAEVSGVVVDPEFNFDDITKKANGTGLILPVEKKNEAVDPLSLPKMPANWGVEYISNNYGVAKLELFYHPQEKEAWRKKQFVAEIYDYCQYEKIDLVLELMVYHAAAQDPDPEVFLESQLESVREFSNICDVFALEYLNSPLSAVTITAETDNPWIYNAREVGYEEFKQNLRVCMDSGAAGFMAGDPFWSGADVREAFFVEGDEELEAKKPEQIQFIKTNIRDRVIEAVRIVGEAE